MSAPVLGPEQWNQGSWAELPDWRRRLRVTREGRVYLAVTLGIGLAALNTGSNPLFLVLGLMLGLIVVSGILSELTIRDLALRRRLPPGPEAEALFPVELLIRNDKPRAASLTVEVRDSVDGRFLPESCFFLRISPGEEKSVFYRLALPRRGRVRFDGVALSTRYPFGLFEKTRWLSLKDELVLLPARREVPGRDGLSTEGVGQATRAVRGAGEEFQELREMVPGDDPRRIHWKTSARLGRPVVRETEAALLDLAEIVLDPVPESADPAGRQRAEENISLAYSLLRELADAGRAVRLITPLATIREDEPGAPLERMLWHLALLDPQEASTRPPAVALSQGAVLVGPRAAGVRPALRLEARAGAISPAQGSG